MTNHATSKLPVITVIIPAFNEASYLPSCLTALNDQTYPKESYHVIVIDNNSTDATAHIARKFGAEVMTEKKQGYIYALNTGLRNAQGDIIAVTDADTQVHRDWIEKIVETFQNDDVVAAAGSVHFTPAATFTKHLLHYSYALFLLVNFSLNKPHLYGANMVVRKKTFDLVKKLDERYRIGGDVHLGLQLKKFGKVVYNKEMQVTTSLRRYSRNRRKILKDVRNYSSAYFHTVWLQKPTPTELEPVR